MQNKSINEAEGPSICFFFDDWCCCWKLTFRTTVVTPFSLHPISLRWVLLMNGHDKFCPLWEELSPYVPQVQKSQGWREAWQAEPWRFFLVIAVVNTITRARATRGFFFTPPSSHTEWIHVHLYICHPQQADTGKERHPELVTPISLAEGRQEQIRPTRLTRFCLVFFWLDILVFPLIVNSIL